MCWKFRPAKSVLTVVSSAYYIPIAEAQLISPQRLFNKSKGVSVQCFVEEDFNTLIFDVVGKVQIDYDTASHLHTALAKNRIPGQAKVHLAGVLSDTNLNISPTRKLLLHWHCRVGRKSLSRIQALFRSVHFLSDKFLADSRCELPLYKTCQYAKAHR